jgi:predicted enzyme related to lactoylglutathione lyase
MKNNHISYIELTANDLEKTKIFYHNTFGWEFTDYGVEYTSFNKSGLFGGFKISNEKIVNGALVVLYHDDLNTIKEQIISAGGKVSVEIFTFPGGSRFHFLDPSGNELAVWSDK